MKNWIPKAAAFVLVLSAILINGTTAFAQSQVGQAKNQTAMNEVKIQDLRKDLSENLSNTAMLECRFHVSSPLKPTALQKLSQDIRNMTCDKLEILKQKIDGLLSDESVLAQEELNQKGLLAQKIAREVILASFNHTIEVSRIALQMIDQTAKESGLSESEKADLEKAKASFQSLESQAVQALSIVDNLVENLKNLRVTL